MCREYERLLPLVRDDAAPGRLCVGATGSPAWMGRTHCACGIGPVQAVWAAGLCGCCGERRLGGRHGAGGRCAAGGGSDARFGLACAGSTSASSRSCATMTALERLGVGATGPLAWMGRGVAHAASGRFRRCGPRGCAGAAGSAGTGTGTAPAGDARRTDARITHVGKNISAKYPRRNLKVNVRIQHTT